MKLCKLTMLRVGVTDESCSSEYADSLQFDHHVNVLHLVPVVVREAKPFNEDHTGRRESPATVIPPPAAVK